MVCGGAWWRVVVLGGDWWCVVVVVVVGGVGGWWWVVVVVGTCLRLFSMFFCVNWVCYYTTTTNMLLFVILGLNLLEFRAKSVKVKNTCTLLYFTYISSY